MRTAPDRPSLSEIAQRARRAYVGSITGGASAPPWWTAVIVTASSNRQAERYEAEIERRRGAGTIPPGVLFLVVPDLDDVRIGSGGATLNAIRALAAEVLCASGAGSLEDWWRTQRVLLIHSGGDSRRLPEYSLAGKLFSALPIKTPWGDVSTVFDETLALSTDWAGKLADGLVVASGDVILTFDAGQLDWSRPGVSGVAMRQPIEIGSQHGVYVVGDEGRVYSFLQKPSAAEVRAAGGMLAEDTVALDIGLIRFDVSVAARLTELAGVSRDDGKWVVGTGILGPSPGEHPEIDLYEHMTLALIGQGSIAADSHPGLIAVGEALQNLPFWCSLVDGDFTHVGTTSHYRRLMTGDSGFSKLYTAQQRLGAVSPPGVASAGVIVDSVFARGAEVGAGSVVIECEFAHPVRVGRNAILHGLTGLPDAVFIPDDTVVHQAPVRLEGGEEGVAMRVYGVQDDPKLSVASGEGTWFGRPMIDVLSELGVSPEEVWPGLPASGRRLWNALLFAFGPVEEAWDCASWMLGMPSSYDLERWRLAERLSLASSARWADGRALADARSRRLQAGWKLTAVALADSGSDIRPMLARAPGLAALVDSGETLQRKGSQLEADDPTQAASRHYQASLFLAQAGLETEAGAASTRAFHCVHAAVKRGSRRRERVFPDSWTWDEVTVAAPARVDFGGGWSDTPPFCLDWGGTVLNIAVAINGGYPIATTLKRLDAPLIRCVSVGSNETVEFRTTEAVAGALSPGSAQVIPRAALRLAGVIEEGVPLEKRLRGLGGGLEIRTQVNLPIGSGLGTSSILAATMIEALAVMSGLSLSDAALSDDVMCLEQLMTTGGGWQDQAGGIFPGAKLLTTGPGLQQRLRVQPLNWTPDRQAEFTDRFVLYNTGIRRIAKNLLAQVVGSYLAREVATVQVLHSIKTLAMEMAYAMTEGEWSHLGGLMNRHWELNQILDPHTTNAPIDLLLRDVRPFLDGAKLAGAGGGGFLMLLAKSPEQAGRLRIELRRHASQAAGSLCDYEIAQEGLRVECK